MLNSPQDLSSELCEAIAVIVARWGGKVVLGVVGLSPEVIAEFNRMLNPVGVKATASLYTQLAGGMMVKPKDASGAAKGPDLLVFTRYTP